MQSPSNKQKTYMLLKQEDIIFSINKGLRRLQKQDLIHLHSILVRIKYHLENNGVGEFTNYQKLQISPLHIHRSKADHKYAIFILGSELARATSTNELHELNRISIRLQELAKQYLRLEGFENEIDFL